MSCCSAHTTSTPASASFAPAPFRPRRGLHGAHRQTILGNFLPQVDYLPAAERETTAIDEQTSIFCDCCWQLDRASAPTLVIVHGLEGSSRSHYAIGLGGRAWRLGWNVARMNMRNCGGGEHMTPTLYHSGLSGDLQALVARLQELGARHVAIAGFSLGGNMTLKCVGEWGSAAPEGFFAAAAVSPCCDLAASGEQVHRWPNYIYEWWFLISLRDRLRRKAQLFPERYDLSRIKEARSIRRFDDLYTAPCMGLGDAAHYYATQSASRLFEQIARPTLVIHSTDDPVVRITAESEAKMAANPHMTYLRTKRGGHCGFVCSPNEHEGRWAEAMAMEYLQAEWLRRRAEL